MQIQAENLAPTIPAPPRPVKTPSATVAILVFLAVGIGFNALGYLAGTVFKWSSILTSAVAEVTIIAGFPILVCLVFRYNFRATFRFKPISWRLAFYCVIAGLGAQFLVRLPNLFSSWLLDSLFGPINVASDEDLLAGGPLLAAFTLVVLAPLCEETLNRGFLMTGIRPAGFVRTVLIVGLFFGLFHQYPYRLLDTALGGMVLAYIALTTGSTLASIAAHFGFNLFPTIILLLLPVIQDWLRDNGRELSSDGAVPLETVITSILITLVGAAITFLMLRVITAHDARRQPGLVLNYYGLARDFDPNATAPSNGDYYGPGATFFGGDYGLTYDRRKPLDLFRQPYNPAPTSYETERANLTRFHSGGTSPELERLASTYQGRYQPPAYRRYEPTPRAKFSRGAIIAFVLVLLLFALTSFSEIAIRLRGDQKTTPTTNPNVIVEPPLSKLVYIIYK